MSDNPGIQWALELLAPDPNIKPTIVEKYTPDIIGIIFGSSVVSLKNWFARRPLSAGLQAHGIAMVLGIIGSRLIKKAIDEHRAEQDTILRDYIIRHPDLFPAPERVKFRDAFYPWTPIR